MLSLIAIGIDLPQRGFQTVHKINQEGATAAQQDILRILLINDARVCGFLPSGDNDSTLSCM